MHLNPIIEAFYKSALDFAGMALEEDGSLVSYSDKPTTSKNGNIYHLPYFELTKHPEGKAFFHILNENYRTPETEAHNLYKNNAILALNVRFSAVASLLLTIASDVALQKAVQNTELLTIIAGLGEVDRTTVSNFDKVVKAAEKEKGLGFFFNIYVKKDGMIGDKEYLATGKVNCHLYKEALNAQEKTERGYEIFGSVVRKRDVEVYLRLVELMLPGIQDELNYTEGVEKNKIFRCLDAFLRTAYLIAGRLNEIIGWINEELQEDTITQAASNVLWAMDDYEGYIGLLYDIGNEISILGNHDNVQVEAALEAEQQITQKPKRLNIDDSAAARLSPGHGVPVQPKQPEARIPEYNPGFGAAPPPQETARTGSSITDMLRQREQGYGLDYGHPPMGPASIQYSVPEVLTDGRGNYFIEDYRTREMIPCDPRGNILELDAWGNPLPPSSGRPAWLEQDLIEEDLRRQGIDPRVYAREQEYQQRMLEERNYRMTGGGRFAGVPAYGQSADWQRPAVGHGGGYGHGGYYPDNPNIPNPGAYDYGVGGYDHRSEQASVSKFNTSRFR